MDTSGNYPTPDPRLNTSVAPEMGMPGAYSTPGVAPAYGSAFSAPLAAPSPVANMRLGRWLFAWLMTTIVVAVFFGIAAAFMRDGEALGQGVFFGIIFGGFFIGPVVATFCIVRVSRIAKAKFQAYLQARAAEQYGALDPQMNNPSTRNDGRN